MTHLLDNVYLVLLYLLVKICHKELFTCIFIFFNYALHHSSLSVALCMVPSILLHMHNDIITSLLNSLSYGGHIILVLRCTEN